MSDSAQIISRLAASGTTNASGGEEDKNKLVKTDSDGLIDSSLVGWDIAAHLSDTTKHLTSAQNTWIDSITATATEINYLSGVTSYIGNHIADTAVHLSVEEKNFLTGITVTSTDINTLSGISSNVQVQLNNKASLTSYNTHIADTSIHLTSGQNTLLDNLSVSYQEVNRLSGVTSSVQTQLDGKLPITYLDTDTSLAADSNSKVPSQHAVKYYTDLKGMSYDSGWSDNLSIGSKTATLDEYTPSGNLIDVENAVASLMSRFLALEYAIRNRLIPNT